MKYILFFSIILVLFSCKEVVEENIWDELTPAQQAKALTMAELECKSENASVFQNVFDDLIAVSTMINTTQAIAIDYTSQVKNIADADYNAAVPTNNKVIFDVNTVNAEDARFVASVDSDTTYYQVDIDTSAAGDFNDEYWETVKTRICSSASTNVNYNKVSIANSAIVYSYSITASKDDDSDGNFDTVVTTITYTISPSFPAFIEYFNKTKEVVTTYNGGVNDGKTKKVKETWTPKYTTTKHGNSATDTTSCPGPIYDDGDYSTCFKSGMGI